MPTTPAPTLADLLAAARGPRKGPCCTVKIVLEQLDRNDRAALVDALESPNLFGTTIADVLRKRGVQVGPSAIQRHRAGRCGCGQ